MKTIIILIIAYAVFVWFILRWLRSASRPDRQFRHEEFAQEPTESDVTPPPPTPQSVKVTPPH